MKWDLFYLKSNSFNRRTPTMSLIKSRTALKKKRRDGPGHEFRKK